MKKKLKIGILINTYDIWSIDFKMLKRICNSDYAEISLIIKNEGHIHKLFNKVERKGINKVLGINYILVIKYFFQRILKSYLSKREMKYFQNNLSFHSNNIKELLTDVPIIKVKPRQTKYRDFFSEKDIDKISEYNLDVLIRCGFRILSGTILQVAKYGIWSFHHGDNDYNRGGPAGFWEYYEKWKKTGSILQILSEDLDNGLIISKTFSKTDEISHKKNIYNLYIKTSLMLTRKLKELHDIGGEKFMERVYKQNATPNFYDNRLFKAPELSSLINLVLRDLKFRFYSILKLNVKKGKWILMYNFQDSISSSFWRFKKIIPPLDKFWADPFIVNHNDKYFIFIEEFDYKLGKGHISYIKLDKDGNHSTSKKVLEEEYHLSYPYIFNYNGTLYMIPESSENNTIDLYYCEEFPNKWLFKKTLINNINAHDASLLVKDDKFWLFVNIVEDELISPNDELHIFYSDNLLNGEWKEHPQNPVISDVEKARSAGKLFYHNEQLYRPSQNCTKYYGYGLNINRIEILTTQQYKETTIKRSHPNWSDEIERFHTFNFENRLAVIDAFIKQ